ncbi:deacetoxyvindoline 4-hydroxylase [Populus alba]|uniref:deacetoxyvindoline 4-hydroxylase n=1 Tax=Populus alba TaxID=43335 RepID=UPI00158F3A3F|nr:deacetoxyvindoline 4-hydroxylase-like [Populus alba]
MQSDLVQNGSVYDIEKELQAFDESKSGVKGLVDARIIKTPPFFVVPEREVSCQPSPAHFHIPAIDLKGIHEDGVRRREIVEQMCNASETWGFFQVVNHGISKNVMEGMVEGVKGFHEEKNQVNMEYYTRDTKKKLLSFTYCREIEIKYLAYIKRLGGTLLELLSEALGLLDYPFARPYWRKFQISENRVLANHIGPKTSVASFFAIYDWICAPLKELISYENPLCKEVPLKDYIIQYRWKERDGGISTLDRFRL